MSSESGAPSGYGSAPAAECLPPAFLLKPQYVPDAAGSASSFLVQNEENNVENGSNYEMSFNCDYVCVYIYIYIYILNFLVYIYIYIYVYIYIYIYIRGGHRFIF